KKQIFIQTKALDNLEEQPYFLKIYGQIFRATSSPFVLFSFLKSIPLKKNVEFFLLIKEFDDFLFKMIEQRKLEMSKTEYDEEHTDLLTGILEAASHEKYNYTNKEL
ncbi:10604_t:CDS:1, partial [Racocetra persica]